MSGSEATASSVPPAPPESPAPPAPRPAPTHLLESAFGLGAAAVLLLAYVGLCGVNNVDQGDFRPFGSDTLDHIPIKVSTTIMGQIFLVFPAVLLLSRFLLRNAGGAIDAAVAAVMKRPRVTVGVLAGLALVATVLISWLVLQHCVLTDDESIQLFQAQLLEYGRVTTPIPELRPFFDQPRLAYLGHVWTGIFCWGHPAILAIGDRIGFPQLIPHLSAPLTVILTYALCREVRPDAADRPVAVAAAFFVATSPFLVFTAASLHNATTSVVLVLVGAWLLARHRRRGGFATALLAGLVFGFDLHVRPFNAIVLGSAGLVLTGIALFREGRSLRPLIGGFALGAAPWIALHGILNWALVGTPFRPPITKGAERPIFGFGNLAFSAYHTPVKALGQLVTNLFELVVWFSGSAVTMLVFLLGVPRASARARRLDWLWLVPPGALLVAYVFFYRTPPIDTGPTYFLDGLPFLAIFVAQTLAGAPAALARFRGRPLEPAERTRAARAAVLMPALLITIAFATFWPEQVHGIERSTDATLAPFRAVAAADIHHAIVLWHYPPVRRSDVTQPPLPDPDFSDDVIYAHDREDDDETIADAFPDRKLYVLKYQKGEPVVRPWQPQPKSP